MTNGQQFLRMLTARRSPSLSNYSTANLKTSNSVESIIPQTRYVHTLVVPGAIPARIRAFGNNSRRIAFNISHELTSTLFCFSAPDLAMDSCFAIFTGPNFRTFPIYEWGAIVTGELYLGVTFGGGSTVVTEIVTL